MAYVLHLDDDPDDIELFREMLSREEPKMGYKYFLKPVEGLEFLTHAKGHPCVIVIDLNMPIMGGKEVMKAIKSVPELQEIPLVCFTTSNAYTDHDFCLKYCDAFFIKPIDIKGFPKVIQTIVALCGQKSQKFIS